MLEAAVDCYEEGAATWEWFVASNHISLVSVSALTANVFHSGKVNCSEKLIAIWFKINEETGNEALNKVCLHLYTVNTICRKANTTSQKAFDAFSEHPQEKTCEWRLHQHTVLVHYKGNSESLYKDCQHIISHSKLTAQQSTCLPTAANELFQLATTTRFNLQYMSFGVQMDRSKLRARHSVRLLSWAVNKRVLFKDWLNVTTTPRKCVWGRAKH